MFLESASKAGWIEVICGSMFSGKTEELIRRLKRAQFARRGWKFSSRKLISGIRRRKLYRMMPIQSAPPCGKFRKYLTAHRRGRCRGNRRSPVFRRQHCGGLSKTGRQRYTVIVAGLDMDFLGNPSGPMPQLMAIAEYVTKVHAICVHCGNIAQHSHRLTANDRLVMLGEKDTYEPLCRHCFNKAKNEEQKQKSEAGKLNFQN